MLEVQGPEWAGSGLDRAFKELGSPGLGYLDHGGNGGEAVVRLPSSSPAHEGFYWLHS